MSESAIESDPREPIYQIDEDLVPPQAVTPEFEAAVRDAMASGFHEVLDLIKGVDHNARNWGVAHAKAQGSDDLLLIERAAEATRRNADLAAANASLTQRVLDLEGLVGIQPEWAMALPIQMQSVLLLSTRGADGVAKHHASKGLIRMYRACVIKAAAARRMLVPGDDVHDTFMDARSLNSAVAFAKAVDEYFSVVDELPFHYHLHLVHGAEILGYKHPDDRVRAMWHGFYLCAVDDMHLTPETESQLDARLNDFGSIDPALIPSPAMTRASERPVYHSFVQQNEAEQAAAHVVEESDAQDRVEAVQERMDVADAQVQAVVPSLPCGMKQGGSNTPCIKPKGHPAPHHDGTYVW